MPKELDLIFKKLKGKLRPYKNKLTVLTDKANRFELTGNKEFEIRSLRTERIIKKKNAYFVGIIIQKSYVGFYFMPPYSEKGFMDEFSPEMKKRLKGKSCFHFKKAEEIDSELDRLLKKASVYSSRRNSFKYEYFSWDTTKIPFLR